MFSFRTPITIVALAFYSLGAGLVTFFAATGSLDSALVVGAISFGTPTGVWLVGYRYYVPARVDLVGSAVQLRTRRGGLTALALSTYTLRLNRVAHFGSSLTYFPTTEPSRVRGIYLTEDQTQNLIALCPEICPHK